MLGLRTLALCLSACLAAPVFAACLDGSAEEAARTFYQRHYRFYSSDPARLKGLVTPPFLRALEKEYRCAQGEVCALGADPWTGAQDGAIRGMPVFEAALRGEGAATVALRYDFALSPKRHRPQTVRLVLRRDGECWRVEDLVTPEGASLRDTLEKWHKEYGQP